MLDRLTRPVRNWQAALAGLLFCIALAAGLVWMAVRLPLLTHQISPDRIAFAVGEDVSRPQRFETRPDPQPLSAQLRSRQSDTRRFNFTFARDGMEDAPHALYLPHVGEGVDVYLNGARTTPPTPHPLTGFGWGTQSLWYEIPRYQLLPGTNRVYIYMASDPSRAGLGAVYLGSVNALAPHRARRDAVGARLRKGVFVFGLVALGLNLLALVIRQRSPVPYLLGAGSLAYLSLLLGPSPWPALLLLAMSGLYFLLRLRAGALRVLDLLLVGAACVGPVFVLLRGLAFFVVADPSMGLAALLVGPLPILLSGPIETLVAALRARQSRVRALETQLDDTQSTLETEISRRAVFEERERLTRDIHDGVGGQLLGLLLRLRTGDLPREDIARDLQAGLNDLRLVVDALDHTGNDLGRALSAFQERAGNSLDAAGLALHWHQADMLDYTPRNQNTVLNLYRLLQEAFNNIINHAQASTVEVEVYAEDDDLVVTVRDDGIGRAETAVPGRGTLNMQRRAELLDGTLVEIEGLDGRGHGLMLRLAKACQGEVQDGRAIA